MPAATGLPAAPGPGSSGPARKRSAQPPLPSSSSSSSSSSATYFSNIANLVCLFWYNDYPLLAKAFRDAKTVDRHAAAATTAAAPAGSSSSSSPPLPPPPQPPLSNYTTPASSAASSPTVPHAPGSFAATAAVNAAAAASSGDIPISSPLSSSSSSSSSASQTSAAAAAASLASLTFSRWTIPTAAFRQFILNVIKHTQLPVTAVSLALYYILRLKRCALRPIVGNPNSEYRVFSVALMLANKFLDDNTYTNKTWAEVTHLPLKEMSAMEVEFLANMRYSLVVSADEWERWQASLRVWLNLHLSYCSPDLCVGNGPTQVQPQAVKRSAAEACDGNLLPSPKKQALATPPPPMATHPSTLPPLALPLTSSASTSPARQTFVPRPKPPPPSSSLPPSSSSSSASSLPFASSQTQQQHFAYTPTSNSPAYNNNNNSAALLNPTNPTPSFASLASSLVAASSVPQGALVPLLPSANQQQQQQQQQLLPAAVTTTPIQQQQLALPLSMAGLPPTNIVGSGGAPNSNNTTPSTTPGVVTTTPSASYGNIISATRLSSSPYAPVFPVRTLLIPTSSTRSPLHTSQLPNPGVVPSGYAYNLTKPVYTTPQSHAPTPWLQPPGAGGSAAPGPPAAMPPLTASNGPSPSGSAVPLYYYSITDYKNKAQQHPLPTCGVLPMVTVTTQHNGHFDYVSCNPAQQQQQQPQPIHPQQQQQQATLFDNVLYQQHAHAHGGLPQNLQSLHHHHHPLAPPSTALARSGSALSTSPNGNPAGVSSRGGTPGHHQDLILPPPLPLQQQYSSSLSPTLPTTQQGNFFRAHYNYPMANGTSPPANGITSNGNGLVRGGTAGGGGSSVETAAPAYAHLGPGLSIVAPVSAASLSPPSLQQQQHMGNGSASLLKYATGSPQYFVPGQASTNNGGGPHLPVLLPPLTADAGSPSPPQYPYAPQYAAPPPPQRQGSASQSPPLQPYGAASRQQQQHPGQGRQQ